MAETKPDKPGFFSRLFGRKAEPAPETPKVGGEPEAMPSPPATAADDLTAVPPTVTTASPDTEEKLPSELAGADLQPVEGVDPEGLAPLEPIPQIVTEKGPEPRPD